MRNATDPVAAPAVRVPGSVAEHVRAASAEPWAFDYFALMRRLEALAAPAPRWGRAMLPGAEPIRIGQEPSLSFAPASFSRFEAASAHSPPRLRQHFFGYLGPNGPLPVHLSDFIRERSINHGDPTWLAFLDSFAHRFSLFLYRAWAQARPAVGLDRPHEDGFRRQVGALIGIGTAARERRDEIHDDARLHFSGHLARRVHNAESVESVIGSYFGVPVRLEPWVGHWMVLPAEELSRLGRGTASRALGGGAMLGRRAWDRQHRVRLHLGPLSLARYADFLPIGSARPALQRWMQQLLGDELYWDARLILESAEVPATRLGGRSPTRDTRKTGDDVDTGNTASAHSAGNTDSADTVASADGHAARLGWTSWLGRAPRKRHAADVCIDGEAFSRRARPSFSPLA